MMNRRHHELLTLRRPTRISELCDSVPKPRGSVPSGGLPIWEEMALDAKLPMMAGPKGAMVFSRDQIGRKSSKGQGFILYDPNCYDVSYKYEPLHDENLRVFFYKQRNMRRVRELGLVTEDGGAICSLKEFNEFRRYLKRLHLDSINKEREFMEELEQERRALNKAREYSERDVERSRRMSYRWEKCRPAREERAKAEKERWKKERLRQKRYQRCQLQLAQRRKEIEETMRERVRAFDSKIRYRVNNANTIERYRKILTLRRWHASEKERNERMERQRRERRETKEQRDLQHWHLKVQNQMNRLEREKEIMRQDQQDMEFNVAIRNKVVTMERLRMDEFLVNIKNRKLKTKEQETMKSKAILKAITKALEEKATKQDESVNSWLVEKSLHSTLAEMRNIQDANEVIAILHGAREKLEKEASLPEEVIYATEELLNNVIKEHVRRSVTKMLSFVIKKAVDIRIRPTEEDKKLFFRKRSDGNNVIAPMRSRSLTYTDRTMSRNMSLVLSERQKSNVSGDFKVQRGVSFGAVSTINSESVLEEGQVLTSIKDRLPTPIPSLTDLAEAVFREPEVISIIDESNVEKQKLDKLFNNLSKLLLRNVFNKATQDFERKYRGSFRKTSIPIEYKMNDVINRITEKILTDEEEILNDGEDLQLAMEALSREVVRQYCAEGVRHTSNTGLTLTRKISSIIRK